MSGALLLLALVTRDPWWGADKAYHLTVSHLMANALAMHSDLPPAQIALITLGVGIGKEVVDATIRGTGFSLKDLFWDGVGTFGALYLPPRRPSRTAHPLAPPAHALPTPGRMAFPSTGTGARGRPFR